VGLLTFITSITSNNAIYGTSDVEVQVVGIAFNLIIIRADRRAQDEKITKAANTTLQLQGLRRPMASDTIDSVRFNVVDGVSENGGSGAGKTNQILDPIVSNV